MPLPRPRPGAVLRFVRLAVRSAVRPIFRPVARPVARPDAGPTARPDARLPLPRAGAGSGDAVRRIGRAALVAGLALSPLSAPTLGAFAAFALAPRPAAAAGEAAFDIDTADAATLAATLPGIGPVKARRIVEHRERHGPFGTLDALLAVKGIGPATLARIRSHLAGGRREGAGLAPRSAADGAGTRPAGRPLSTSELERATRKAVRGLVLAAERDAAPYRRQAPE